MLQHITTRRGFIAVGLATGATIGRAIPGTTAASAEVPATLWKLSADWGFPAGKKGRTRCAGRACHAHAANKLFLTHAEALNGRTHRCCNAQPYPVVVSTAVYSALSTLAPTRGHALADLRDPAVAAVISQAGQLEFTPGGSTPPPGVNSTLMPRLASPQSALAVTATNDAAFAAVGAGLAATGAAVLLATRARVNANPTPSSHPCCR